MRMRSKWIGFEPPLSIEAKLLAAYYLLFVLPGASPAAFAAHDFSKANPSHRPPAPALRGPARSTLAPHPRHPMSTSSRGGCCQALCFQPLLNMCVAGHRLGVQATLIAAC
jgi:hypothetical protein